MIVLIGDIVKSKQLISREEVQNRLQTVLENINKESKNDILSPHTITLGDEFQAVYNDIDHTFDHIWQILYKLYPVKIRFSVGIGEITTKINPNQAIGMDGPAFHYARKGIEKLKAEKKLFILQGEAIECLELIVLSLFLISDFMQKWEEKRFGVLYGLSRNWKIKDLAEFLDITERSVYKNIQAGSLEIILNAVEEIVNRIKTDLK